MTKHFSIFKNISRSKLQFETDFFFFIILGIKVKLTGFRIGLKIINLLHELGEAIA